MSDDCGPLINFGDVSKLSVSRDWVKRAVHVSESREFKYIEKKGLSRCTACRLSR